MKKRPFTLTDLEDRALAACDDMYLETAIARDVLSTWFNRTIPFRELRQGYEKRINLGLLRTYKKRSGRIRSTELRGHRTQVLLVRATLKGVQYLNCGERYVV